MNPLASIEEIQQALHKKTISAKELTEEYLKTIKQRNPSLNALITITEEQALQAAAASDQRRMQGKVLPLDGIPIIHKDLFCTRGIRTTAGSKMLADFIPDYDATVIAKLHQAGMIMLAKASMDEFAMGSSNETSYFGAVKNPWNTQYVPGGSSGGSAACVAASFSPLATGSDTGGSIRQPAAFCGISGMKPTYGLASRYGMIAFASSLDQAGLFSRHAKDFASVFPVMCGHDPHDSTSANCPLPDYQGELQKSIAGIRIGLPTPYFEKLNPAIADKVREAAKLWQQAGAKIIDIELQASDWVVAAYYLIACSEASSNLSRFDGVRYGYRAKESKDIEELYCQSRSEAFGIEVKRRIMLGTYALSAGFYDAYYQQAKRARRGVLNAFTQAFKEVDVILGPTTPTTAYPLGRMLNDPLAMYQADVYTVGVNLAGLPALSLPVGLIDHMPVGAQLIGPHFSDALLIHLANEYQMRSDHHLQQPPEYQ